MLKNVIIRGIIIYFLIIIICVIFHDFIPGLFAIKISALIPIPFFILIIYGIIKFFIWILFSKNNFSK